MTTHVEARPRVSARRAHAGTRAIRRATQGTRAIRRALARALVGAALATPAAWGAGPAEMTPPDVLVKSVTQEVMDIIAKDAELQAGDRRKTIALVEDKVLPHFDFARMTSLAMSTYWQQATPEQKARLEKEFKTLLVRTYASSIAAYREYRFNYRPLRAAPGDTDVTVSVRVVRPGAQAILIEYDMEKTPQGWKVWDVRVAGISLVINYRTEFANLARESGVAGVVKALAEKNASIDKAAGGTK